MQTYAGMNSTETEMQAGREGFTLIELSVVLVIIGLIVGGVLVGQDLIRAAYIRAQITQIEKFNTAVNTFYGKFQALPGDMNNQTAAFFGFSTAVHNSGGNWYGQGNGDGMIQGNEIGQDSTGYYGGLMSATIMTSCGETGVFWVDLSSATAGNLIEGGFNTATENSGGTCFSVNGSLIQQYVPAAKLGGGNSVYVTNINGINYYGVENIVSFLPPMTGAAGMTVAQAYNIDKKIDDGFPATGNVAAMVTYLYPIWVMGGPEGTADTYVPSGSLFGGVVGTAGNASGPTTCFDAATGAEPTYSMEQGGGAGLNCALIFKMQGGD